MVLAQALALHRVTLSFLLFPLSTIRGSIRLIGVTEALPSARSQITGQAWLYVLLTVFIPFLYLVNFVNSLLTRRIRWRGLTYELISPEQTRVG
jgi:hypothetical protein